MQKDVLYSIILIMILILGAILYVKNISSTTTYERPGVTEEIPYNSNISTSTDIE